MIYEEWRPVVGYEGLYEVSNMGRVRSLDRLVRHPYGKALKKGKIIKPTLKNSGYYNSELRIDGRVKYPLVHRIVYEAFVGPIPEGMQINHINEDKTDNRLENLNLMSPKENISWGTCIARRAKKLSIVKKGKNTHGDNPNATQILQFDKDGNLIKEWDSIKSAADHYGICVQSVWRYLKGKVNPSGGYIWKYKRDVA